MLIRKWQQAGRNFFSKLQRSLNHLCTAWFCKDSILHINRERERERENVLQGVGIGNRLECSTLFMQLMSLECLRVCNVSVSAYNINYLTLHFPGKIFWHRGLLFQNFLLLSSPLHQTYTSIKCFSFYETRFGNHKERHISRTWMKFYPKHVASITACNMNLMRSDLEVNRQNTYCVSIFIFQWLSINVCLLWKIIRCH